MVEEIEEDLIVVTKSYSNRKLTMDHNYKPSARPAKAAVKDYVGATTRFFSPWGEDDNLWPMTIMDSLRACAPAQVCIEILATLLYGNGIRVYERDSTGKLKVIWNNEQQQWFRQTNISQYLMRAAYDYFTFANQFPQLISNRDTKNTGFGAIANTSAPWVRLSAKDKSNLHTKVFVHGQWDKMPEEKECQNIELINIYEFDDQMKKLEPGKSLAFHVSNYTPGNADYADHPWHALVRNGTLDIFPEIPKVRKNRIKNAMFIKYHIRVHEYYWYLKFGGIQQGKSKWEALPAKERKKQRNELYTSIDTKLAGSDNSFKSIFTPTYTTADGKELQLITIDKIETEVGESAAFDPDKMSNVADVFLAFGIPSSVANTVLSDNKSRGGGSDIREGNTSIVTRLPMHRDNLLFPVELAMRNTLLKSGPLLAENQFLGMDNTILTTLDESKNGTTSTSPVNTN